MFKDMLVHLDGTDGDEVRLQYAEPIASTFDAYLTGVLVNEIPEVMIAGDPSISAAQVVVDLQNEAVTKGDQALDKLKGRFSRLGVGNELRRIDVYSSRAGALLAAEARMGDIFVATRPYGHSGEGSASILEAALFDSGRGMLFVPPEGSAPAEYETILLAWQNTREAARAVADAMPFLTRAKKVIVAIVDEAGPVEQRGLEPGADIARHLDRHGVNVELRHVEDWQRTSDALLNEVAKSGAQMVVMGGYGHSRFREWILGGTTRDILGKATVPVLVAH